MLNTMVDTSVKSLKVKHHQKGKTNADFTEANNREWQWHQLVHTEVFISLQTDKRVNTAH